LLSKVSTGKAVPRDILQLKISLKQISAIREALESFTSKSLSSLKENLIEIPELVNEIEKAINQNFIEGSDSYGVINKGFHTDLDELKDIMINGKTWMENFQSRERKRTGINSLKVAFNKVFGYYIDITRTHADKIPQDYIRKQTLVN